MKRIFLLCTLLVSAAMGLVMAAGCGHAGQDCTGVGCASFLNVEFPGDRNWETGSWTVTMMADGSELGSCTFDLPEATGGSEPDCDDSVSVMFDSTGESLTEVTYRPTGEPGQSFDVQLERDGQEVATDTLEPEFSVVQPNGEGCSPTCYQATSRYTF